MIDRAAQLAIAKYDPLEERRAARQKAYTGALVGAGTATAAASAGVKNAKPVAQHVKQGAGRLVQSRKYSGAVRTSVARAGKRQLLVAAPHAASKLRPVLKSPKTLAAGGALVALGAANEKHRRTRGKPYSSWYDR